MDSKRSITIYTKRIGKNGRGILLFSDVTHIAETPSLQRLTFNYVSRATGASSYAEFRLDNIAGYSVSPL